MVGEICPASTKKEAGLSRFILNPWHLTPLPFDYFTDAQRKKQDEEVTLDASEIFLGQHELSRIDCAFLHVVGLNEMFHDGNGLYKRTTPKLDGEVGAWQSKRVCNHTYIKNTEHPSQ